MPLKEEKKLLMTVGGKDYTVKKLEDISEYDSSKINQYIISGSIENKVLGFDYLGTQIEIDEDGDVELECFYTLESDLVFQNSTMANIKMFFL